MNNGANRGIKAVLHIVNKFVTGQNNVAHLCIQFRGGAEKVV